MSGRLDSVGLTLVDSLDEAGALRSWLGERRPVLGVDTETGGLDFWRQPLRTVQLGDERRGWLVPVDEWRGLIRELLERYARPMVMHNAKFDLQFLEARGGVKIDRTLVHDTQIMAVLDDNLRRSGLKFLGVELIDPSLDWLSKELRQDMAKGRWGWDTVPITLPSYWQYGALDPVITVAVAGELWPRVQPFRELYEVERACQLVLVDMERRGVRVDLDYVRRQQDLLEVEARDLASRAREEWGVENLGSDAQVRRVLAEEGVSFTGFTAKTGEPSLADSFLRLIDHPLAEVLRSYRHAVKIAHTYLASYLDLADGEGLLHPSVYLNGAATGRMSVSRPSLQNLERSRLVRDSFVAREGRTLLCVDYDQIELRLLASYARDPGMIQAFLAGVEMHSLTARRIFGLGEEAEVPSLVRQHAKTATYTKLYGGGPRVFAEAAGVTEEEAMEFYGRYDRAFPALTQFTDHLVSTAKERGWTQGRPYVSTFYGRRLFGEGEKEYKLLNYLIQGTAAEVLKRAMIRLDSSDAGRYLVLPVHDELVLDVPLEEIEEVEREVLEAMRVEDFVVPLTAEARRFARWGEKYAEKGEGA